MEKLGIRLLVVGVGAVLALSGCDEASPNPASAGCRSPDGLVELPSGDVISGDEWIRRWLDGEFRNVYGADSGYVSSDGGQGSGDSGQMSDASLQPDSGYSDGGSAQDGGYPYFDDGGTFRDGGLFGDGGVFSGGGLPDGGLSGGTVPDGGALPDTLESAVGHYIQLPICQIAVADGGDEPPLGDGGLADAQADGTAGDGGMAVLRVINISSAVSSADIFTGGDYATAFVDALDFGTGTDDFETPIGTYTFDLVRDGAGDPATAILETLADESVSSDTTLVVWGDYAQASPPAHLMTLPPQDESPNADEVAIRFVHASQFLSGSTLAVYNELDTNTALASGVAVGDSDAFTVTNPDSVTLGVDTNSQAQSLEALFDLSGVFDGGDEATLFFYYDQGTYKLAILVEDQVGGVNDITILSQTFQQ